MEPSSRPARMVGGIATLGGRPGLPAHSVVNRLGRLPLRPIGHLGSGNLMQAKAVRLGLIAFGIKLIGTVITGAEGLIHESECLRHLQDMLRSISLRQTPAPDSVLRGSTGLLSRCA